MWQLAISAVETEMHRYILSKLKKKKKEAQYYSRENKILYKKQNIIRIYHMTQQWIVYT